MVAADLCVGRGGGASFPSADQGPWAPVAEWGLSGVLDMAGRVVWLVAVRRLWGCYSVADHLEPRAFVADFAPLRSVGDPHARRGRSPPLGAAVGSRSAGPFGSDQPLHLGYFIGTSWTFTITPSGPRRQIGCLAPNSATKKMRC